MTTTFTIVVIIAMLWLAWPRTPKVPPQPSLINLVACRHALLDTYNDFLESRPRL